MIKAVLFDFDGTLANTLPFYVRAYKKALKQIGFELKEEEIVKQCFGKKEDIICAKLGLPEKTAEFAKSYFEGVKTLFKTAELFPDTLKTIEYLRKRNIKIAIITFAYRWYISKMMNQFELSPLIDLIISTDDVKEPKPNPESVFKTAHYFNVQPGETMVVGDSKSDILMAKNAGSKSFLMFPKDYTRFYDFAELQKTNPDFTISSINELTQYV